jgi:MFS family permease
VNIRSLTRGDGVVIGAAVVLLIASFLDNYSVNGVPDSVSLPSLWASGPVLLSVVFAGIIGAALVVVNRCLPQPPKVVGLDLGQFGAAFAVFAAWSALGNVIAPAGGLNNLGNSSDGPSAGTGLVIALIATLVMAGAAVATPLVPALQAALVPAAKPAAPQPYGAQPPSGYGYPGAPAPQQPYGAQPQPGQPFGQQQPAAAQPQAAAPAGAQPAPADFSPFWFAVPVTRPLFGEDGAPAPIAELAPGTWYLAVEQRGATLVAQTQDGRRGVLQDTSGIQRG